MHQAQLKDNNEAKHATTKLTEIGVLCPNPRPVWNFNVQRLVSPIGTSLGNILEWNACIVEAECCCPCTYEIVRDGVVVGTSHDRLNFTGEFLGFFLVFFFFFWFYVRCFFPRVCKFRSFVR